MSYELSPADGLHDDRTGDSFYPPSPEGLEVGAVWQDKDGNQHMVTGIVRPDTVRHNEGDVVVDPDTGESRVYTTADWRRDNPDTL